MPSGPPRAMQLPHIKYKDLTMQTVLGEGSFGSVNKAQWRETPVAVKACSVDCARDTEALDRERAMYVSRHSRGQRLLVP